VILYVRGMLLHWGTVRSPNVVSGKEIRPVFSMLRSCKRMHLRENVPCNAPQARNDDDRGETEDEIEDDARGGKKDRQMRLPDCRRRGSCTPLCTQPYRPSRVMRCDCMTAYDCVFRTRYRLDRLFLSLPLSLSLFLCISNSTISACRKYRSTEKHDCDRYFVTRS